MNRVASSELRVARTKFRTRSPLLETRKLVTYMNWLYPNFLKKIDHYLKINYPHIWRTRVHDFGWFSLILGNGLAVLAGILVVGRDNVLSQGSVFNIHLSLAAMLCFVGLFWVMHLLRFKIKFSDSNTMFTTWLIYVLCVGSLGLNLVTFTATTAYQTAYLYSDKAVQTDDESLSFHDRKYHIIYTDLDQEAYLKDEHRTSVLLATMARHGHTYTKNDKIYQKHIMEVAARVRMLKEAKVFLWQPFLGRKFKHHENRSIYHDLFVMHWAMGGVLMLFLPTLLFLVSLFGVRNVLISIFGTAILTGVSTLLFNILNFGLYGHADEKYLTIVYAGVAFILAMILAGGRHHLKNWNYLAGVFMLMLGVVFFASFIFIVEDCRVPLNPLLPMLAILPASILISLVVAWTVAKRNDMPTLR